MAIDVEFSSDYGIEDLAREWRELEARARPGFFLSWTWIGCWLAQTAARPMLVRAKQANKTIALGFLARRQKKRHGFRVRQLLLNETGVGEHDRLTIEHNGFLCVRDLSDALLLQVFSETMRTAALGDWDEIVLSGVSAGLISAASAAGLSIELDRSNANYRVDLSAVRAAGDDWMRQYSSNFRAQLRQSRTAAERIGPVTLTAAETVDEALAFFEAMRSFHDAYWQSRHQQGAFATEFARQFHRALIVAHTQDETVELLRLSAGGEPQGYLYNFICNGTVSNYQSGFSYSENNRNRPGLLAHAMAIERAISRGCHTYDFLAGEAAYKARFGTDAGPLIWCRAQRDRPVLAVERRVRKAKQTVVRLFVRR